jgi:hypothetical protein
MAPPKTYSKEQIFRKAFEMALKDGIGSLTARGLARKLKSSIVPIYTHFKSMDLLRQEIILKGIEILKEYIDKEYMNDEASNMGIGIVLFARDYPNFFRALYLERDYTGVRGEFDLYIRQKLSGTAFFRNMAGADFDAVFIRLIMFMQGYCTLVCTGEMEDTSVEAIDRHVNESCDPIIYQAIFKTDFTRILGQLLSQ